mgnify:CR=1 FL=1
MGEVMSIPEWVQQWLPIVLVGAIGYCIGSLRDAHVKLDNVQKKIENLHNQLYRLGALGKQEW